MAKANNERKALIAQIMEDLKKLDVDDLIIIQVNAARLTIPVVSEMEENDEPEIVETEDEETISFDEGDGDEDDLDLTEGEDDLDLDLTDEDEDPFAEEEAEVEEDEETEEDPFADPFEEEVEEEEAKPVGRRNREKAEEKKPAKTSKPALKKIQAPNPLVRMQKSDADLGERKVMGRKLVELGIKKETMPNFEAETLHKGLRTIYARIYGPKALSLESLEKKAAQNGIEVAFPRGNRGNDLKAQAILVTLMNEKIIPWPTVK